MQVSLNTSISRELKRNCQVYTYLKKHNVMKTNSMALSTFEQESPLQTNQFKFWFQGWNYLTCTKKTFIVFLPHLHKKFPALNSSQYDLEVGRKCQLSRIVLTTVIRKEKLNLGGRLLFAVKYVLRFSRSVSPGLYSFRNKYLSAVYTLQNFQKYLLKNRLPLMDIETKRITNKSPNFLTIHCSLEDINIFLPQELCILEPNYHKSYCSQFYKLFANIFLKVNDMSSTKTVTLSSQNSFSPIFICQQSTEFQKLKPENPSVIIRDFVNMRTTGLRVLPGQSEV